MLPSPASDLKKYKSIKIMEVLTLEAEPRTPGKSQARNARREEKVPCVLYGRDTDPVSFTVPELAMRPLIFTNETHRVSVEVDGDSWECILKTVDFHPVTDFPIHADFQVLTEGQELTLTVPVRYVGTPMGQTEGGDTQYVLTEIDVRCMPKDIPTHIEVNVEELEIGDSIHVRDLEKEGLEFAAAPEQTLVTVVPPVVEEIEEPEPEMIEVEGELVEAGEVAEGEGLGEGEEGEEGEGEDVEPEEEL